MSHLKRFRVSGGLIQNLNLITNARTLDTTNNKDTRYELHATGYADVALPVGTIINEETKRKLVKSNSASIEYGFHIYSRCFV